MNTPTMKGTTERLLLACFRRMVGAFPRAFAEEYGSDIVTLLADQMRGRRTPAQLGLFLAATADLSVAIPREHVIAARALQPRPVVAGVGGQPPARIGRPLPSRRRFLRAAMALTAGAMGSGFAAAGVAYLWPRTGAGFGSLVDVGSAEDALAAVVGGGGTYPVPAARVYLVAYDTHDDPEGDYATLTGGTGMMALYQKCVHLGCRVPWCGASSWFECPCHGSQYNRWGEYQAGPAPRGLDRFPLLVEDGRLIVDTRLVVTGPSRGVDTLGEPPRGPHCGSINS